MVAPSTPANDAPPADGRGVADASAEAGSSGSLAPSFSPLYQQIKGLILRSLQAGEWKAGDMIPSELELAARFKVSQGTVRKAIDELATDNLLVRRQGKGTFVATHAEQNTQYRFLRLLPDNDSLETQGPAERRIVECRRLRAPADVSPDRPDRRWRAPRPGWPLACAAQCGSSSSSGEAVPVRCARARAAR